MPERFNIIANHGNPQEMATIPRAQLERLRAIAAAAEALLAELEDSASVELGDMISADTLERFRRAVRD